MQHHSHAERAQGKPDRSHSVRLQDGQHRMQQSHGVEHAATRSQKMLESAMFRSVFYSTSRRRIVGTDRVMARILKA